MKPISAACLIVIVLGLVVFAAQAAHRAGPICSNLGDPAPDFSTDAVLGEQNHTGPFE